ncbi:hypothetical protein [Pontibaca salina]|uniref:Uncharacterized protein n=1 Tax=Pontibaca salina TaxID=2795731 RepID=A0A934M1D5_9RHOB|nr:hypothetical protein [Pontibaca salina]MBI6629546.1 hypothetical protein [Pontibaca salina]
MIDYRCALTQEISTLPRVVGIFVAVTMQAVKETAKPDFPEAVESDL